MFRRNLIPVWVAVIVLASMYLMGQGWSPPPPPGPPAPVAKTGQTTSYATGDDGDFEKGVVWPSPRFTDNGDGTVTDDLTGLVWTKNADCDGAKTWSAALSYCNTLADGTCDLTDESVAGDWRLPNVRELQSLIDYGVYAPALPTGHPFTDVWWNWYWSSTTYDSLPDYAWPVHFYNGSVCIAHDLPKDVASLYVWCVRDGQ